MKMSPEGKVYLQQVMDESQVQTLRFSGITGCCGVSLSVALEPAQQGDRVAVIEGIEVAIHPDVESQLTDVTMHAEEKNGELELVLIGYMPTSCC